MMKLVRCVVPLESCALIVSSLVSIGAGVTVYNTRENNSKAKRKAVYRGHEYEIQLPGIVVEVVIDDSWVDDIIRRIIGGNNGSAGDRAIQVIPIEESYRIRDGFMEMQ